MARELVDVDIRILRKLAPEMEDLICRGSGVEFHSILPPVANHFATDDLDLSKRLERLSREDLQYLLDRINDGSESLGCLPPEAAEIFFDVLTKGLSWKAAETARERYESAEGCDI